jgi:hypothetical protein
MTHLRIERQEGFAVVAALMVMFVLLAVGLAVVTTVDVEQRETGRERQRESTFALAEGVLNSQIFLLGRQWPGQDAAEFPQAAVTQCTPANAADRGCPDTNLLVSAFTGADFSRGISWSTEVHDNPGIAENFYDDAVVRGGARKDLNDDGLLWVRAEAILPTATRPKRRVLVALVRAEELTTNFPRHAIVAGSLTILPKGNHQYIDTDGSGGTTGEVIVRCSLSDANCASWDPAKGQIGPQVPTSQATGDAMENNSIEEMRLTARTNGTYYGPGSEKGSCPTSLAGGLVFIEDASVCPKFDPPGSVTWNSSADPGVVMIGRGRFQLGGNVVYHGLIYHINGSDDCACPLPAGGVAVELDGGAQVIGGIIIDGTGQLKIGSNNGTSRTDGNVIFDPNARNKLKAFGTAGIVQNSFREIRVAN